MFEAQQSLDTFTVNISDRRGRRGSTVGELGSSEPLRRLPVLAFPAEIVVDRVCSRSALVAFETNQYSVPPGDAGQLLTVRARVDSDGWRFRVQFSDGRKATSYGLGIGGRRAFSFTSAGGATSSVGGATSARARSSEPSAPVLASRGLSGGRTRWQIEYWLWPLPPPGEFAVACECPDIGVELTTAMLDGDGVLDAAARARQLLPADA
jgi:hypothetical protein